MNKIKRFSIFCLWSLGALSWASSAALLPQGGRGLALAGSMGAAWGEMAAIARNPAAQAAYRGFGIGAEYMQWPAGFSDAGAALYSPWLSIEYRQWNASDEGRDASGLTTGQIGWRLDHLQLSSAMPVYGNLDFGLGYEYLSERFDLGVVQASSPDKQLGSLGLLWHWQSLGLGAALLHEPFGNSNFYPDDASRFELQAAWKNPGRLLISQAASYDLFYQRWEWAAGLEGNFQSGSNGLALRGGWSSRYAGLDGAAGFSLGLGFGWKGLGLDYAWVPQGSFGSLNMFSVHYGFGAPEPEAPAPERKAEPSVAPTPEAPKAPEIFGPPSPRKAETLAPPPVLLPTPAPKAPEPVDAEGWHAVAREAWAKGDKARTIFAIERCLELRNDPRLRAWLEGIKK